jgi:hypothetical protein
LSFWLRWFSATRGEEEEKEGGKESGGREEGEARVSKRGSEVRIRR